MDGLGMGTALAPQRSITARAGGGTAPLGDRPGAARDSHDTDVHRRTTLAGAFEKRAGATCDRSFFRRASGLASGCPRLPAERGRRRPIPEQQPRMRLADA